MNERTVTEKNTSEKNVGGRKIKPWCSGVNRRGQREAVSCGRKDASIARTVTNIRTNEGRRLLFLEAPLELIPSPVTDTEHQ